MRLLTSSSTKSRPFLSVARLIGPIGLPSVGRSRPRWNKSPPPQRVFTSGFPGLGVSEGAPSRTSAADVGGRATRRPASSRGGAFSCDCSLLGVRSSPSEQRLATISAPRASAATATTPYLPLRMPSPICLLARNHWHNHWKAPLQERCPSPPASPPS